MKSAIVPADSIAQNSSTPASVPRRDAVLKTTVRTAVSLFSFVRLFVCSEVELLEVVELMVVEQRAFKKRTHMCKNWNPAPY